ncbi:MAG: glycosyltransferase [Phycisphaeraceae bacterium]
MPADVAGSSRASAASDSKESEGRRGRRAEPFLLECAWEVCNQVGGIYTVLRSKVPSMVSRWSNRYCLIGPYLPDKSQVEFEPRPLIGAFGQAVKALNEAGIEAHFGRWLVTGRPNVVLINHLSVFRYLYDVKARMWRDHHIPTPSDSEEINNVVAFGEGVRVFLQLLAQQESERRPMVAHFHEWQAGTAIPMLRQEQWPGAVVFTTHATRLGRVLAMQHPEFYGQMSLLDSDAEAKRYNLESQHGIEKAAAHGSHVFTTVSDITGDECRYLLGRSPDVLLPNGLNIQRFAALHEFQNLHAAYKDKIHEFTIGHFFPSYSFDLDTTLYFFTSGRYEYRNKGMDVTIEALARLNHRLRASGSPVTVVFFIITKAPVRSINVQTLETRSMLSEFHDVADAIKDQVGKGLVLAAAEGRVPDLNELVDEYWRLRLRRALHAWRRHHPPPIVTHDLLDDQTDDVLNQLRGCRLFNHQNDPVKVIYHPAFITTSNPLFGMDYEQFVRGCHLGVFPSYYEPWGYTPLESIALGVPALTSDLSGFGSYLMQLMADHEEKGVSIVERRYRDFNATADQIAEQMFRMCQLSRRERITLRNSVESFSEHFDWHNLGRRYHEAHALALDRVG